MEEQTRIVFADFENYDEYILIKGKANAMPTLEMHRAMLQQAKTEYEQKGYLVEIETCDLSGYQKFLKESGALNSPQCVAAYVASKKDGAPPNQKLQHQNITIVRDRK